MQRKRSTATANQPLSGKEIATPVENQYILEEIETYQKKLALLDDHRRPAAGIAATHYCPATKALGSTFHCVALYTYVLPV
jgi:hypothetical protein